MRNKTKKLSRGVAVLGLAIMLALNTMIPAFAANDYTSGTDTAPAQATITKMLTMPEGTTTPGTMTDECEFEFVFAKKDLDGVSTQTVKDDDMPSISNKTVIYTAMDAGSVTGGVKNVAKEVHVLSGNATGTLSGEYVAGYFKRAGVYTYSVTETKNTYTITDTTKEALDYSDALYEVSFYVDNGTNGTYVKNIEIYKIKDDSGTELTPKEKVNGTPGDGNGMTHSAVVFKNMYTKTNGGGGDPTVPGNQVLNVNKAVAGSFADQTKYFPFDLTVTQPATVSGTVKYKAYIVAGTANVTSTDNFATLETDATYGKYIEITAGTMKTINLKHGQSIVFTDLPVGSQYLAVEQAVAEYTAKLSTKIGADTPFTRENTSANTALSTGPDASTAGATKLGEKAIKTDFTNTYKTVTPTGISINNLPFIMLLLVAIGGFVTYIIVKSRRKYGHN